MPRSCALCAASHCRVSSIQRMIWSSKIIIQRMWRLRGNLARGGPQAQCGAQFTSKLEGMFKDVELSHDIVESFGVSVRAARPTAHPAPPHTLSPHSPARLLLCPAHRVAQLLGRLLIR